MRSSILDQLEKSRVDVSNICDTVEPSFDWHINFWLDMESSRLEVEDVVRLLPEFLTRNRFVTNCSSKVKATDTITTKYYFDVDCEINIPEYFNDDRVKIMKQIARTVLSLIAHAHYDYLCSEWNEVTIRYNPDTHNRYHFWWARDFANDNRQ